MENLISTRQALPPQLTDSLFADRGKQFVDRLNWNLCVTPKGYEVDEYDDQHSEYLVVHRNGQHQGSCRVRPTTCSTMIEDHFLESFPDARDFMRMQKGRLYELTRFCRAPNISVEESKQMLKQLAVVLDDFRDRRKLTGFVAVVFPQIARFLDSIGVRYLLISKSTIDGRAAYMICITHAVDVSAAPEMSEAQTPRKSAETMLAA